MSTAILPARPAGAVGTIPMTSGVPAIVEAMTTLKSLRTFVAEELEDGIDYGTIPGTGTKKVMLLPGAQKVAMYLNVYPEYAVQAAELGDGHVEYIVDTILVSRNSGARVGSGIGSCSTKEGKYRYRSASKKCTVCGQATIIKGKDEYGGGWICFAKKGGCGAKFRDGDKSIESQATGQVENDNIYDQRNTVLKMAKKRSLVDASIGLACLADQFTQDIEDTYDLTAAATATPPHAPAEAAPETPAPRPTAKAAPTARNTEDRGGAALETWLDQQGKELGKNVKKWTAQWGKTQGYPDNIWQWSVPQAEAAHAATMKRLEQMARDEAAGTQAAPSKAATTAVEGWDAFADRMLAKWNEFDPTRDPKERTARENRLVNALATAAVEDDMPKLSLHQISSPNAKGVMVRETAKVWNAVKGLLIAHREWVENAADLYLGEKFADIAAALEANLAPLN